jgi:hypothetical protein
MEQHTSLQVFYIVGMQTINSTNILISDNKDRLLNLKVDKE